MRAQCGLIEVDMRICAQLAKVVAQLGAQGLPELVARVCHCTNVCLLPRLLECLRDGRRAPIVLRVVPSLPVPYRYAGDSCYAEFSLRGKGIAYLYSHM